MEDVYARLSVVEARITKIEEKKAPIKLKQGVNLQDNLVKELQGELIITQNMVKHVNAELMKLQISKEIQQKKDLKLEAMTYLTETKVEIEEISVPVDYTYIIPDSVIDDVAPNASILLQKRLSRPFAYDQEDFEKEIGPVEPRDLHTETNGSIYFGQFRPGTQIKHGRGAWLDKYFNGKCDYYEGYWRDGYREGKGRWIGYDGRVYQGEWRDDRWEGKGLQIFDKDDTTRVKYSGDFVDSYQSGQGTMTYRDGSQYVGEWKEDERQGFGTLYEESGNIQYQGQWDEDVQVQRFIQFR